jgi:hypothetical protein
MVKNVIFCHFPILVHLSIRLYRTYNTFVIIKRMKKILRLIQKRDHIFSYMQYMQVVKVNHMT